MAIALRYAARSDVGLVRAVNQDSGYAGPHLLAVADGMGGHAAGDVASSIAIGEMVGLSAPEMIGARRSWPAIDAALRYFASRIQANIRFYADLAG